MFTWLITQPRGPVHTTQVCHFIDMSFLVHPCWVTIYICTPTGKINNFIKIILDDRPLLRPKRYYTSVILLHYYFVDPVWVLTIEYCKPIISSPLGTSFSGSKGLIRTPIAPAGAEPLAIFNFEEIKYKDPRKIAKLVWKLKTHCFATKTKFWSSYRKWTKAHDGKLCSRACWKCSVPTETGSTDAQSAYLSQLSLRNCLYLLEYIFLALITRYLYILQYLSSIFKQNGDLKYSCKND